ncbi:MAG: LysR family transcriptional regulator [Gammaproteobacteria bacterium]|nr:LysR family transcriptional regulator [Gammaproteobacteria bacterium]MCW5582408.1 LysR family transcriptional regulator [Gammaproteobacteria bacterium]
MGLLSTQLEAFMAVANHKSVHAGARAIHISQAAMTQRIHALEQKLKITLFIRTRQGMHLTSEGEQLLRYCHVVSDYSNETLANIANAGIDQIQRVKISGPSSIMISRIIPNCLALMKKFPMLYITFDINDTNDIITQLRCGASQFAIFDPDKITRDMEFKTITPEKYLLVCTSQWKSRKLLDIIKTERIIDFDESDKTTLNYLKQFDLLKFSQTDRLFVNRNESLCKMFLSGYGYGTLTKEFAAPYFKTGDLIKLNSGKIFEHSLSLAWYSRPKPPQYFLAILETII